MSHAKGPWCAECGHEYRTKEGAPEPISLACPYCGSAWQPVPEKPFVEMSKSMIERWEFCPASFYFKYILHRREPQNKYARMGILLHKYAEDWLKYGRFPKVNDLAPKSDETRMALSVLGGIPHMPPPTLPALQIETELHFAFEGLRYVGWKDYWAPLDGRGRAGPPNAWTFDGTTTLTGDHKSTGNFNRIPTEDKLANDLQLNIYAWDDIRRGASGVWGNWDYMLRGERAGKAVRAFVEPARVYARMKEINETSKVILKVLQAPPPASSMETRGASQGCKAFGEVCPHLSVCHVNVNQRLGGILMSNPFPGTNGAPGGLDALVAQMNAAPQFTPPPGVAAPAPAPTAQVNPPAFTPPPAPTVNPPAFTPLPASVVAPQFTPPPAPVAPPATFTAPAPAPAAPPPADPNAKHRVTFKGLPYDVEASKVQELLNAGATYVGPVTAAPPPAPAPAVPMASPVAPANAPGRAPGRGRPKKAAAQPAPVPTAVLSGEGTAEPIDQLLADIAVAISRYFGEGQ